MIFALAKIVPSDREAGEARIKLAKASERIAEITSLRPALVSTSEGKGFKAYAAHHRDAFCAKPNRRETAAATPARFPYGL